MHRGTSLALLLLALCAGCASEPLVQKLDPAGRRFVLLLDASTSMRANDPEQAARAGAELAIGLVGTHDNVAVVPYARRADVLLPLTRAGDTANRARLRAQLAQVSRSGVTNFVAALGKAREVLEAGHSPPGSAIVLLTDGVPYRQTRGQGMLTTSRTLDDEVSDIAAKGWRIFAIALGDEGSSPFLSRLVGQTGGTVVKAAKADDLLKAFQDVATEALGYLRAERGAEAVRVVPHTRRLAFLGRWSGTGGEIGDPRRDGKAIPADRQIRLPAQGPAPFAVTLVESPEAGSWEAPRPGASEAVTLVEPSFGLEFEAAAPPAEVPAGQPFQVTVRLSGDAQVVARYRRDLALRARLEVEGQSPGSWTRLRGGQDGLYGQELTAPAVTKDAPASVVVEAKVGEDDRFVLRRSRALAVRAPRADEQPSGPAQPRPQLTLQVAPARLELRLWAGEELPARVQLRVRGDPDRSLVLRAAGLEDLELQPGEETTLELPCPAAGGALELQAESPDAQPASVRVPLQLTRYELKGPARVTLTPLPAGFANAVALPYELAPQGELRLQASSLRGPSGLLPVTLEQGKLRVEPPADTLPGTYRGRVRLSVAGVSDLAPQDREVLLEILPAWAPPAEVTLEGDWGWATQPVEVSLPRVQEVPLQIRLEALTWTRGPDGEEAARQPPRIDPELDMRWKPLDGWSGERLDFHPRRLALSVFLSSDLPAGVYTGSLSLVPQGAEPTSIPITLEVRR